MRSGDQEAKVPPPLHLSLMTEMTPCHSSRYALWVAVQRTPEAGHYWHLQVLKSRGLGAQGGGVRGRDVLT